MFELEWFIYQTKWPKIELNLSFSPAITLLLVIISLREFEHAVCNSKWNFCHLLSCLCSSLKIFAGFFLQ